MIVKLPKKRRYYDGEIVNESKLLFLPVIFKGRLYWLRRVTITKQAFNMYYEASHWVSWKIIKVVRK